MRRREHVRIWLRSIAEGFSRGLVNQVLLSYFIIKCVSESYLVIYNIKFLLFMVHIISEL